MIKSLCKYNLSGDLSKQFQPTHLALMANDLCQALIKKVNKIYPGTGIYNEQQIIDRRIRVEPVEDVHIRIRLNRGSYYDIIKSLNDEKFNGQFVEEQMAENWLK